MSDDVAVRVSAKDIRHAIRAAVSEELTRMDFKQEVEDALRLAGERAVKEVDRQARSKAEEIGSVHAERAVARAFEQSSGWGSVISKEVRDVIHQQVKDAAAEQVSVTISVEAKSH